MIVPSHPSAALQVTAAGVVITTSTLRIRVAQRARAPTAPADVSARRRRLMSGLQLHSRLPCREQI